MKYHSCTRTIGLFLIYFSVVTKCNLEKEEKKIPDEVIPALTRQLDQLNGETPTNAEMNKIIGGKPVTNIRKYSSYVALIKKDEKLNKNTVVLCGGTVIGKCWVLTAAHCLSRSNGTKIPCNTYDVITELENKCTNKFGQRIKINDCFIHPEFNSTSLENDIALIQLDCSVNSDVKPAKLPRQGLNITGKIAKAVGTGVTKYGSNNEPCTPREVDVNIYSRKACLKSAISSSTNFTTTFCAGKPKGGADTCQGDSGGPLYLTDKDIITIVGITSYGINCGLANFPGVYTKVQCYVHWIANILGDNSLCCDACTKDSKETTSRPHHTSSLSSIMSQLLHQNLNLSDAN